MARSIGNALPDDLREVLSGEDLAKHEGITFLVVTTNVDGWPHVAMVSVGELIATGPSSLRAALYKNSTASQNLARDGRATVALVHNNAGYSIKVRGERRDDIRLGDGLQLATFDLQVEDILKDVAPYATLTSGVTYRLNDPASVFPRWEEQVRLLRARR